MTIYCVYRPPFGQIEPRVQRLPDGLTLAELADKMTLPAAFKAHGVICINGEPVPRGAWHLIKPKAVTAGISNAVTFHAPIMGGGDDGKNPLALIAGLALTVLSGGAAGGLFATSGGLFAANSISSLFLAGGISLVGSLLLNALVPPPTLGGDGLGRESRRDASARGNVLEPNGVPPRVIGERRVFPVMMMEPLVTYDGDDEVVEAIYGLNGPHRLNDIQLGAADIADIGGVELQTREGWPGGAPITLFSRYGRTQNVGQEMRGHQVSADDGARLDPDVDVGLAVPQPVTLATRRSPDAHEFQIAFAQGLGRTDSPDDLIRMPIRLRMRRRGSGSWRRLPEIHYQGSDFRQLRATIRLLWQTPIDEAATVGAGKGFVAAFTNVPAQTVSPAAPGWTANSYFYDGSGDTYVASGNLGTTGVKNCRISRNVVEFVLDPAVFNPGVWEVELVRGAVVRDATWSDALYQDSGVTYNLFEYSGSPASIPFPRSELTDTIAIQRSVSIWNSAPVTTDDFALIALRGRNVAIDQLSVLAGGYVRDWTGTEWSNWRVTSNPAPHYRDVLLGAQNADPLPLGNIDDAGLVAWRAACIADGHKCDAVISDGSAGDAMAIIAGCGYARPYMSDRWGVIRDYDRSAEAPVQLFTPRNTANFKWSKAFRSLPDGFRVTFDDAAQDYQATQISVFRNGISRDNGLMEQIRYEGVTTEAAAIARARYDLAQLELRATLFSVDVAMDAIVCRRGSLVGLVHDAVARRGGFARVLDGGANGVRLDDAVECSNEPDIWDVIDIWGAPDIWALGLKTQAQIRYPNGNIVTVSLSNSTGITDELEFETPVSAVPEGSLIATSILATEYRRMIVFGMQFKQEYEASLTLVDEANGVFA